MHFGDGAPLKLLLEIGLQFLGTAKFFASVPDFILHGLACKLYDRDAFRSSFLLQKTHIPTMTQ